MGMYKKAFASLMAIAVITFLAGCSDSNNTSLEEKTEAVAESTTQVQDREKVLNVNAENKLIWCIIPSTSNPYFQTVQTVAEEVGKSLGYAVKCDFHYDDIVKQEKLFDTAIEEGASFIICDNAEAEKTVKSVQKAYDAGIGVFLIDREMKEEGIAAAQIVSDSSKGAMEVAKYLVEQTGGEGDYAELLGRKSDENSQLRSDAFHMVIDDTDMQLVATEFANWDQALAQKKTKEILQKNPKITAIICGNDTMACGAAEAVKAADLEQEVYIIGIDGSNDMRDNIEDGFTTATTLQQIDKITRMAVEQGDTLMTIGTTGQEEEKQIVKCILINQENTKKLNDFIYEE